MIFLNIEKKLHAAHGDMLLDLNLHIQQGQLVTLYGASGAGKTSTLRMLSGLFRPDKGKITVNGEVWFDSTQRINLKPQQRTIGFVFQDYALFPNMTVLQNLEFALNKHGDKNIISELIAMVELGDLQNRKPATLSGGQKQRVALARALVQQPKILLLDEPLSALDANIRSKLQDYLLRIHQRFNLTTLLISHDKAEICKLSDWVFVLDNGQLQQQGTPTDIFIDKKNQQSLQLTGKVVDIVQEKNTYTVSVLIENQVIVVNVSTNNFQNLCIGDKVRVAFEMSNPVLLGKG